MHRSNSLPCTIKTDNGRESKGWLSVIVRMLLDQVKGRANVVINCPLRYESYEHKKGRNFIFIINYSDRTGILTLLNENFPQLLLIKSANL